ncbi:MAG: polymer-forming cytoskeletal protein [Gemmatimonadetes bacterium]|nr:polymer-forming cytoskeletal protein [Gemmatimonadota bacterium]
MAIVSTRSEASLRDGGARSGGREALSVIAAGTKITGELVSDGIVKIEGTVIGSIHADRQVLVAKGGIIQGDIFTRDAIVGGEIHGAILADERVEVQASSIIHGDITTLRIVIHEGGEVNGHVRMGNPQAIEQAKAEAATKGAPVAE